MTRKNILLIILITVLIGGVYLKSKNSSIINKKVLTPTPTTTLPTPTQKIAPQYSVTVTRPPVPSTHGFSFEVLVENISITPYITNFAFYECNFIDKTNRVFKGSLMEEKLLDKAILPGESQTIIFNDTNTTINGLEGHDDLPIRAWSECAYDEKGQNSCKNIEGIKITSCIAYISNAKKQASNGWGENPLKIVFP